jgi:hypothetical protein
MAGASVVDDAVLLVAVAGCEVTSELEAVTPASRAACSCWTLSCKERVVVVVRAADVLVASALSLSDAARVEERRPAQPPNSIDATMIARSAAIQVTSLPVPPCRRAVSVWREFIVAVRGPGFGEPSAVQEC